MMRQRGSLSICPGKLAGNQRKGYNEASGADPHRTMPKITILLIVMGACFFGSMNCTHAQFPKPGGAPVTTTGPGTPQQPLGVPPNGEGGTTLMAGQYGKLGMMEEARLEVWAKSIHHTDGTFTESKSDSESNSLQQLTKSKDGVVLQRREVNLNDLGQPAEVLVYDGRGQLKFRGVLSYDAAGRFREEALYTPQNVVVRRKIQEYTSDGRMIPLKVVDYSKNGFVPEGMALVVTKENDNPVGSARQRARRDRNQEPPSAPTNVDGTTPPSPEEAESEKRPGFFRRLFGKD